MPPAVFSNSPLQLPGLIPPTILPSSIPAFGLTFLAPPQLFILPIAIADMFTCLLTIILGVGLVTSKNSKT